MPTVQRTYPTGTYVKDDVFPMEEEINSDTSIGAECLGITRTEGSPDDTFDILFDSAPNEVNLDARIAAYPSFQSAIPDSWVISNNTYATILEAELSEGECIGIELKLLVAFSTGNLDEEFMTFIVSGHRATGQSTSVSRPAVISSGDIPGLNVRATTTGNILTLEFKMRRSGTLDVLSSTIDVKRGRV